MTLPEVRKIDSKGILKQLYGTIFTGRTPLEIDSRFASSDPTGQALMHNPQRKL
jgi:hypothetical protein